MKLKTLLVLVIIWHSTLSLFSQEDKNRFHDYGSVKQWNLKVYGGPFVSLSDVEGSFSADLGVTAGIIINKSFFAGIYAQKLMTNPVRADLAIIGYPDYTDGEIDMLQAGGLLGYIHKPEKLVHWGAAGAAGLGLISLYATEPATQNREFLYDDRVYVVVPKIFVEMNITKWFKVNASAGYRFVGMVNGAYTNQAQETIPTFIKSDYSKPELSVSLLFGIYGAEINTLTK